MADPILHIQDSYYFEIPKVLWQYDFQSEQDVPEVLTREAARHNLHPTLEEYEAALHGKILIPQPFGTLKNLYQPESGFCISRFMVLILVAAFILSAIFILLARRMAQGGPPKGKFWNLFESILVYLRDQVARPAIGGHDADKFVPLLWTMFFFILTLNLLGLVPWAGSATASWAVTAALAAVTFLTVIVAGMFKFGPVKFWLNQVPHMELPGYMFPLKIMIFVIEIVGLCIKNAVLSIRLMANMAAGHLVLLAIMGLAVAAGTALAAGSGSGVMFALTSIPAVLGATALSCLELFVAFLQAYIFTFLSALFIGAATHHH